MDLVKFWKKNNNYALTEQTHRVSYIFSAIRVVDFVEDLRAVLLDGIHLHQVGRKLPVLLTEDKKKKSCNHAAYAIRVSLHRMEADIFVIFRQHKINKINIILCRTSVDSNRTGR